MDQTREAIFAAAAEQLSDSGLTDFNIPLIAERAGVSIRTIYRHFPSKDVLLDELAFWLDQRVGPQGAHGVTDPSALPDTIHQTFVEFDANEQLIRSQWATPQGRAIREKGRRRRKSSHQTAIESITQHLDSNEREAAIAVIAYLCSSRTWYVMKDEHGMNGDESGNAVAWAVRTLIADLQRRDSVAAKEGKSTKRSKK
jgi:AcrR family transcriptional regulator